MEPQSPGWGSFLLDVNLMGLSGVPVAFSIPWTCIEKLPPNLTSTPGSIVRVMFGCMMVSFEITKGLSTRVQTVSSSMGPST